MDLARVLFRDYDTYRCRTGNYIVRKKSGYARRPGENQKNLQVLQKMAEWCVDRKIDPRQWLFALFQSRQWVYAPAISVQALMSEEVLKKLYPEIKNWRMKAPSHYLPEIEQRQGAREYDPNRDITATNEAVKARYLRLFNADHCMRLMKAETLGFHPKSLVCSRCPNATPCEQQLRSICKFDVIAYRKGEITLEQAKIQEEAIIRAQPSAS